MFKRLLLLFLSVPLLWVGGQQGWQLLRRTFADATPPEEKLKKELDEMKGEFPAKWAVRPENFARVLAFSDKKDKGDALSESERRLYEPWHEYLKNLHEARAAYAVLAENDRGDLPKRFLDWQTQKKKADQVAEGIARLCRSIEAGIAKHAESPDAAKQIQTLKKENEELSPHYFADTAGRNKELLADLAHFTPLVKITKAAPAQFKRLNELAAGAENHRPKLFRGLTRTLGLVWLESVLPRTFRYDDKVWIYVERKWREVRLNGITEKATLTYVEKGDLQFDNAKKWHVPEIATVDEYEHCPTSKSLIALAYADTRKQAFSIEHVEQFAAQMKTKYSDKIMEYYDGFALHKVPLPPLERNFEVAQNGYREIWPALEEAQRLVKENPALFGAR